MKSAPPMAWITTSVVRFLKDSMGLNSGHHSFRGTADESSFLGCRKYLSASIMAFREALSMKSTMFSLVEMSLVLFSLSVLLSLLVLSLNGVWLLSFLVLLSFVDLIVSLVFWSVEIEVLLLSGVSLGWRIGGEGSWKENLPGVEVRLSNSFHT